MKREGVYYNSFIYCDSKNLSSDFRYSGDQQNYIIKIKDTDPHLRIDGEIWFKNSYGFLSAEHHRLLNVIMELNFVSSMSS
jgi:hypothetical protein